MTRSSMAQLKHDVMVERLAEQLAEKYQTVEVRTNPGREQNAEVDGRWPDVLLQDPTGGVRAVFEVETADTVAFGHAVDQWADFAKLGVPFYLVVPRSCERAAQALLRDLHLQVEQLMLY